MKTTFFARGLAFAASVILIAPLFVVSSPGATAREAAGLASDETAPCCIAGRYSGTRADTRSLTCPEPTSDSFTMVIRQAKDCSSGIWGEVTGESDPTHVQKFTGTVVPGQKSGCCDIQGKIIQTGEETEFKGTLCRSGGKWLGSGTYTTTRGRIRCSGTWKMAQK